MSDEREPLRATLTCDALSGVVLRVSGRERLAEADEHELEALLDEVDLDAAIGASAYVHMRDELGHERHVHGYVDALELEGSLEAGPLHARIRLRPPQHRLRHRHGFRIFQELATPDIVRAVFRDAGYEDALFRWEIRETYPPRAYCVQYDESEWDFVCRLLEDEGVYFAFEHGPDAAIMVFGDDSSAVAPLDPAALAFAADVGRAGSSDARVFDVREARRLVPAKVALDDYDGLHPSLDLAASAEHGEPHAREHYEYPGRYADAAEGARRARVRLEELASSRRTVSATTDLLALACGRRFEILDHPSVSGDLVIVDVAFDLPIASDAGGRRLRFDAVPRDQRFRPARRTAWPRVFGVQTAKVTGPAGQEIHCDEHGRVKVQFHWDLEGRFDERTTCWIRTAQPHTTGSILIPRIGWEVLVQFEEGDPDRPIVLGHLFNAEHRPHLALPDQKTVTAHRSAALPGGAALNELCFDDAAGAERLSVHAGRDLRAHTVNDKTMSTVSHVSRSVGADRTYSIGANETISLAATHTDSVGGDHAIRIGGDRTIRVRGSASEAVGGGAVIDVAGLESVQVGSPIDAVLSILESAAIEGAKGAAASAANRAQSALLGPIAPVLEAASGALGDAARYAGAAGAILGAESAAVALYGDAVEAASAAVPDAGSMAGAMAAAVASDAFGALEGSAPRGAGDGVWATMVSGDVEESIGTLAVTSSAYGIALEVGGDATDSAGLARMLVASGGYSESAASKTETVGVYSVASSGGLTIDALGAIALNVAASEIKVAKGYSASASGAVALSASSVSLAAAESVTLKCGAAEVIVDKNGVSLSGAMSVTIEATGAAKVKPPAIGL